MISLIKIKDIHQYEDTGHVMLIIRTACGQPTGSMRATWHPRAPCW